MNTHIRSIVAGATALVLAATLSACGGPPAQNPLLDAARDSYRAVSEDQTVRQHAPVALEEAREALDLAMDAQRERAHRELVNHYAYVAQQRAEIARARARLSAAEAHFTQLEREREELRLEARAAEARSAEARAAAERQRAEQAQAEAEAAMARAVELSGQVSDLQAELTARGLVMTMGDVLFGVGRATLQEDAQRSIQVLAQFLAEYPDRRVLIEGHTDSTGSRDTNMRLSRERAEAVRTALVARGVSPDRVGIVGLGPDYPVASNDTAAGRQQNRRVEIIISDADGNIPDRVAGR